MTNQNKFKKAATLRRTTAVLATVLFHGVLIGALVYGGDTAIEMLPDFVQNWFAETPIDSVADTKLP